MRRIAVAMEAAKAQGGIIGRVKKLGLTAAAAANFVRLYTLPVKRTVAPAQVRMAAAW
jgi:magnesium-protoporphyrin IX monomethyl ester (oxidative) cyclase